MKAVLSPEVDDTGSDQVIAAKHAVRTPGLSQKERSILAPGESDIWRAGGAPRVGLRLSEAEVEVKGEGEGEG